MRGSDLAVPAVSAPLLELGESRAWLLWQYALLAAGVMLLLLVFEGTDLDREFARYFFDPDQAAFPLRKAWLLDAVLHHGAKQASFILVAASLFYCWQGWKNRQIGRAHV